MKMLGSVGVVLFASTLLHGQVPEMMQSLLADRFGLRLHRDK